MARQENLRGRPLESFPKKKHASIKNLKNPVLDLNWRIHSTYRFFGLMIRFDGTTIIIKAKWLFHHGLNINEWKQL